MERPFGGARPGPAPGLDGRQTPGVLSGQRLRREIAERGFTYVGVRGTSMLPTLRPGDVVRLEACTDPRPGQIIAFERLGHVFIHRVVRRGQRSFECRGDNRVAGDGELPLDAVVGRAVAVFGAGRPRGAAIRDHGAALAAAHMRVGARRLRNQLSHTNAELTLLVGQVLRRPAIADHPASDLAGLDIPGSEATPTGAALLTARTFGSLPRAARIEVLREHLADLPPCGTLVVHGVMARRRQRLACAGAVARRGLRRLGVAAGEEGDTTWPTVDGAHHVPMHVFTVAQLDAEAREAGGRLRTVTVAREGLVTVWRASVTRVAPS